MNESWESFCRRHVQKGEKVSNTTLDFPTALPWAVQICARPGIAAYCILLSPSPLSADSIPPFSLTREREVQRLSITCTFQGTHQELIPFIILALAINHYPLFSPRTPGHESTELLLKIKPKVNVFFIKLTMPKILLLQYLLCKYQHNLLQHLAAPHGFNQADKS